MVLRGFGPERAPRDELRPHIGRRSTSTTVRRSDPAARLSHREFESIRPTPLPPPKPPCCLALRERLAHRRVIQPDARAGQPARTEVCFLQCLTRHPRTQTHYDVRRRPWMWRSATGGTWP